jgi:phosphoribosylanthranilate isomerase
VSAEIKFCGLTRHEDATLAAALGARYVGAIFAGGPRHLLPDAAARVFADLPTTVGRVGVFADQDPGAIGATAALASLDVVQLHGAWSPGRIAAIRRAFGGAVWPVVRVGDKDASAELAAAFEAGDAVVVDALVPGRLGGTGAQVPWEPLARMLEPIRGGRQLVLAGGLRPENVAGAIEILSPNVVDVSSGVESAPGIKDREKMMAFRDAVLGAFTPK